MTNVTVSVYQQAEWLQVLAGAVDTFRPLASGTPVGTAQTAYMRRSGVLLVNTADLSLTAAGMTHLGVYTGSTLLFAIPWTGGYAAAGQLAYSLGAI